MFAGMRPTAGEWVRAQHCLLVLSMWRERSGHMPVTGAMVEAAWLLHRAGWSWTTIYGLWPRADRKEMRSKLQGHIVSEARLRKSTGRITEQRRERARMAARLLRAGETIPAVAATFGLTAGSLREEFERWEPGAVREFWPRAAVATLREIA